MVKKLLEKTIAVLWVTLLVASILHANPALGAHESSYSYLFVFYVPYADPEKIANITSRYELNSTTVKLHLDIDASPDYYFYWVLTGKRPEEKNILLYTSEADQERIRALWSNATLVDIPLVDPHNHASAINPVFSIQQSHLAPAIIEVPINGTSYWEELGTTIKTSLTDVRLEVTLEDFNISLTSFNVTTSKYLGPRAVNVTKPESRAGEYYISFYLVNISENTIKLFFPGALKTANYTSPGISKIEGVTSHWYLIARYKDVAKDVTGEALEWWLNITATTSQMYLARAIMDTGSTTYMLYVPHIAIARELLNKESLVGYETHVYDLMVSMLTAMADPRKPNYLAVFLAVNEEEANVVFASKKAISVELPGVDLTMSQFVGILLSYSNALPLRHDEMLQLSIQVSDLKNQVASLNSTISELNTTLTDTQNKLATCEGDREVLQVKLLEVEALHKNAENLMNTAQLYLASGLVSVIAISALLGFLAFRASAKKRASR
ncbi:MAG: hypothetical protein QXU03_00930 [Desulfurococcaceae archaeon]